MRRRDDERVHVLVLVLSMTCMTPLSEPVTELTDIVKTVRRSGMISNVL